ncbi:hypothetical protein CYY_002239 [Polysphondylium violaceum]|uniref:Major facilitator superfamily (MFS) profile domain-containing protein n=1 Tax=Polysphondylium violaceum TaxID=133409 RepID=A0A8J4Q838_9MYCE|nr:hypothetical protein CYY_002239 [Polysphondylium violaceum]
MSSEDIVINIEGERNNKQQKYPHHQSVEIRVNNKNQITISVIQWNYDKDAIEKENIVWIDCIALYSSKHCITAADTQAYEKEVSKNNFIEYQVCLKTMFNEIGGGGILSQIAELQPNHTENTLILYYHNPLNQSILDTVFIPLSSAQKLRHRLEKTSPTLSSLSSLSDSGSSNSNSSSSSSSSIDSISTNSNSNNNNSSIITTRLQQYFLETKYFNIKPLSIMIRDDIIVGDDDDSGVVQPLISPGGSIYTTGGSINTDNISNNNSPAVGKNSWFLFFSVSLSVLSTLEFGYNTGVIASTILDIQTLFHLETSQKSILVSILLIGAMIGAIGSGLFVDRIGRKNSLLLNNLLYISGPIMACAAQNFATLLVGRLVTGLAVGIASSVVPLYISEVSPPKNRGSYGLLRQSTVTLGIMIPSLIAFGLLKYHNGWRYTLALSTVPSLIQLALGYWFVETPRWLISKNRLDQAASVMKKLEPQLSNEQIKVEIAKIKQNIQEQEGSNGWLQLLQLKLIKIYFIGFGLNMLQQFVGINCVIYYSGTILEDAGFNKDQAVLISALVGIPQLIMLLVSVWFIDRFGRRPLLCSGLVGMMVGLGLLGFSFYGNGASGVLSSTWKGWLAVVGMVVFKLFFSLGLGPIPAIIAAEIFPSKVRGKAMAVASLLNWLANFIVNISFLHLLGNIGQAGTYWLFGGVSLVTLVFVIVFVQETKGVSIEELSKRLLYHRNK